MTESAAPQCYTLLRLQERLRDLVAACPGVQNIWIAAELSDVNERGGHCYMELVQKDPDTGATVAKVRANIWANRWSRIKAEFMATTGRAFAAGIKVMVLAGASYHPAYGMSLNITAVNPSYTLGERQALRREILARLEKEGILDANRTLELPRPMLRIAVISSAGAAGYGDFMNQLANNGRNLRFSTELFAAVVQGPQTAASVREALQRVADRQEQWDCVCIIRGGGASTDLDGFEDYDLAAEVALFPLPVIVGIGHERDVTVLDYVACRRVKTPTAAAEFLVALAVRELDTLRAISATLLQSATDMMGGAARQLSYIEGQLPTVPAAMLHRAEKRLAEATHTLGSLSATRLQPAAARLDRMADGLASAARHRTEHARLRLDGMGALLDALSPQAVLRRGFSITRIDGRALTDASAAGKGARIVTQLASGTIVSTVN